MKLKKIPVFIRTVTIAPVLAAVMLIIVWCYKPDVFKTSAALIYSLLFLTVLPTLSYPLQKYIPKYKAKGREGQRGLAMIFAVAGYILGCVVNAIFNSTTALWVIYLEYLLSGIFIFILNKLCHIKVSGHACGVVGPAVLLHYLGIYWTMIPCAIIIVIVYAASLYTKRHTIGQLIGGGAVPIAAICVLKIMI
jgi:hypothetical protein